MSNNDIMTVEQAAAELNLSVRAVQHRIKTGALAAEKLDPTKRTSAYLIQRTEVERVKSLATTA